VSSAPWDELDSIVQERAAVMAELGILTSCLIHELRHPLFAMKATVQLAKANGGPSGDTLDRVLEQVYHMESLISYYGSLNDDSEPEALLDLNDPIRAAADMLAHRVNGKGIELEVSLRERGALIRGRTGAMRQVVLNLMQNAIDAVEESEVQKIGLTTRIEGRYVVLEVRDSGPGVQESVRNKLFEPFVTTKPAGRGTGLGLYIVRKLVVAAGGSLQFINDHGTRVNVKMPWAGSEALAAPTNT
jgi:two-component system, NtrC family, C4-dicarboxylate transport sensor histidine kinase DctB